MLSLFIGKSDAKVMIFKFPAGESGVSFAWESFHKTRIYDGKPIGALIKLKFEGNDDLINLAMLVDAIRREDRDAEISLEMLYFPYARQDRVCNRGESFSLKVIANFINSLGFARVFVLDPHSDVLAGCLDNMMVIDNSINVRNAVGNVLTMEDVSLVSPDAGALKKVYQYAKSFPYSIGVVRADKTRDVGTGKITGTVVYSEHLGNTDLVVVDDICDGGGTFFLLAEELRKITNGTVSLFVTHGLFTKGVDIVADVYDNVFVANNMFGAHPKLKEV